MKISLAQLVVSFLAAASFARGTCPANNCNRAVTGVRLGEAHLAQASADCSSYLGNVAVS
jgi:hypothetical protein